MSNKRPILRPEDINVGPSLVAAGVNHNLVPSKGAWLGCGGYNQAVKPIKQVEQLIQSPTGSAKDMAPLLLGGWVPSEEQRRDAEHFGNTGDVFDLLGL